MTKMKVTLILLCIVVLNLRPEVLVGQCTSAFEIENLEIFEPSGDSQWDIKPLLGTATQMNNGELSFLLSQMEPSSNIGVNGNMKILSSIDVTRDDDFVGIVILNEIEEFTDSVYLKAFWFSWKAAYQDGAYEGFRLLKIDGMFNRNEFGNMQAPLAFMSDATIQADSRLEIIATNYSDNGWQHDVEYDMYLSYTPLRCRWYIDGEIVLDAPAKIGECFTEGRIGFANLSQMGTTYSDLSYDLLTVDYNIPIPECSGEQIKINTQSCGTTLGLDWYWSINDIAYTIAEPSFVTIPGINTIKLFVEDQNGCRDSVMDIFFVIDYNIPPLVVNRIACPPSLTINYETAHNWVYGNFAQYEGQNTFISDSLEDGINVFTVTTTTVCGSRTDDIYIEKGVKTQIIDISPVTDTLLCKGESLYTTVLAIGTQVQYVPYFETIASVTTTIPISATGYCGTEQTAITIRVVDDIITSSEDKFIICEGSNLYITDIFSQEGGDPLTKHIKYFWNSNLAVPVLNYFQTDTVAKTTYKWTMTQKVEDRCMGTIETSNIWIEHSVDSILVEDRNVLLATNLDTITIQISEGESFPWLHMQPWGDIWWGILARVWHSDVWFITTQYFRLHWMARHVRFLWGFVH
jgi:hypothetical protein